MDGYALVENECVPCTEHCAECDGQESCARCEEGYGLVEDGINYKCGACPQHCKGCYMASQCDECADGYYLSSDSKNPKCLSCPKNCKKCSFISPEDCQQCFDGFSLKKGVCVRCAEGCATCERTDCDSCFQGYGFLKADSAKGCAPCVDTNCSACDDNNYQCEVCNEGFCLDTSTEPGVNNQCIPCSSVCSVPNCQRCIFGDENVCAQCNYGYQVNKVGQCVIPLNTLPRKHLEPVIDKISSKDVINGHVTVDISSQKQVTESQVLTFVLNHNQANNPTSITIENPNNDSVAFDIRSGIDHLELDVSDTSADNNKFDLIHTNIDEITLQLGEKTHASLIDFTGEITLQSKTKGATVNINKVEPIGVGMALNLKNHVVIDEINFNGTQHIEVRPSKNTSLTVKDIKVMQKAAGSINYAVVTGIISLGLESSLDVHAYVDLSHSEIDIPYNQSYTQSTTGTAPIHGSFRHVPKKIVMTGRYVNQYLASEKILIAQSTQKFGCEEWKNRIENHVSGLRIEAFTCTDQELDSSGNPVFRLYAESSGYSDGKKKKKGVPIVLIAVIAVVAVVVVAVAVIVVVCIIRRKKNAVPSDVEEDLEPDDSYNNY